MYHCFMKRILSLFASIIIAASIYATTIVQISDIHYLSPTLYDYDRLRNLTLTGDGKATHIMDKVMDEFISEMLELSPNAVVVTGDLTYNGEKKSHEELKEKLSVLEKNGIKVFVLMGNHDTGNTTPYALYKDKVVETIGEKKEQAVHDAIAKDHVNRNPVSNTEVIITDRGHTLCYDELSGRYFYSDVDTIRKAANEINRRMLDDMCASLNEFYYEIGLDGTRLGDELGWNVSKGLIDLKFSATVSSDDRPCIVMDYQVPPRYEFETSF